jgi:hypothetical protein
MTILTVKRMADMVLHHPREVTRQCNRCGHDCGVYPSGQEVIAKHADVEIVCDVCRPPDLRAVLAPGALAEVRQSVRKS